MKMILDFAIAVFCEGIHIDKEEEEEEEEEEDYNDRVGTYRGTRAARSIAWLLEMQYLEGNNSNLEIYSVTNRKPVEIKTRTGVIWQKRDLWVSTRANVF